VDKKSDEKKEEWIIWNKWDFHALVQSADSCGPFAQFKKERDKSWLEPQKEIEIESR
jgi:hypothetical protein